jgi:hypothetical protein
VKRLDSMSVPTSQRVGPFRRNCHPPEIFSRVTDILADLLLEDLKQFPQIPSGPRIDRYCVRENTVLLTQEGGE